MNVEWDFLLVQHQPQEWVLLQTVCLLKLLDEVVSEGKLKTGDMSPMDMFFEVATGFSKLLQGLDIKK